MERYDKVLSEIKNFTWELKTKSIQVKLVVFVDSVLNDFDF